METYLTVRTNFKGGFYMLYAKFVDVSEIYGGNEAFDNGETTPITASADNGEGGYVEIYSNKLRRPYRLYPAEYEAFEVVKGE